MPNLDNMSNVAHHHATRSKINKCQIYNILRTSKYALVWILMQFCIFYVLIIIELFNLHPYIPMKMPPFKSFIWQFRYIGHSYNKII